MTPIRPPRERQAFPDRSVAERNGPLALWHVVAGPGGCVKGSPEGCHAADYVAQQNRHWRPFSHGFKVQEEGVLG